MGTKRKAEDEILEINSDEDEDDDVQIQEKPIPIVTVDDDEEQSPASPPGCEPQPEKAEENLHSDTTPPSITVQPEEQGNQPPTSQTKTNEQPTVGEADGTVLLSMKFADDQLFQLFRGSLTEYLKTTFQLKLAGQEVDVRHHAETVSIEVVRKNSEELPASEENIATTPSKVQPEPSATEEIDNGIFIIDSTPAKTAKGGPIVPSYKKALNKVLDNSPSATIEGMVRKSKPKQSCWNCDGDHSLRDCKEPRNFAKINKMKQEYMKRTDRYHIDLEQKYGHIYPGRISQNLRDAMGLGKRDLPLHIYRMRMFGYPPGWLEETKITHSGLQLFDSNGEAVLDSDESEGEVDNVKMKYDVRKIISYPGFNVDAGGAYYDDSKFFGVPPRMEHQSREEMIKNLEGTLVLGYQRKKLRMSSNAQDSPGQDEADMDLDETAVDAEETADVDNAPAALNGKGELEEPDDPEEGEVNDDGELVNPKEAAGASIANGDESSTKDESLILIEEEPEIICLDDTRPASPTLDDLRKRQQELLKQLEGQSPTTHSTPASKSAEDSLLEDVLMAEQLAEEQDANGTTTTTSTQPVAAAPLTFYPCHYVYPVHFQPPPLPDAPPPPSPAVTDRPPEPEFMNLDEIKMSKIPFIDDPASGLKTMSLGTPILTPFTPFNKLPCGDAFSKGVSDVINFENLPNSTGKYERMKSLLCKVRNVISAHNGETEDDSR